MNDYLVTVAYNPGTPKTYIVLRAPDVNGAGDIVLRTIGYNPGVPVRVEPISFANIVQYRPLTQQEKELIRYND